MNQTLDTEIKDIFRVDTLRSDFENLALINNYSSNNTYNTKDVFLNFGMSLLKDDYLFTFSTEQDLLIQTENFNSYNFIDSLESYHI